MILLTENFLCFGMYAYMYVCMFCLSGSGRTDNDGSLENVGCTETISFQSES